MTTEAIDVFNQHRRLLFSIAYRMLGSAADAEDILQDAFIGWQGAAIDKVESPRSFLVTIVSRLCINLLKSSRVNRERYVGQWLPEPIVTQAQGEPSEAILAGESISMAFMLLLERLNPLERAVFILREVFGYEYADIAAIISRSEEHCRQLLHRAHGHLGRERTRFETTPEHHENLLTRFMAAALHGDMDGLLSVLAKDVILYADGGGKAPAVPLPIYGADHVSRLIYGGIKKFTPADVVTRIASVNGSAAIVAYSDGEPRTVICTESDESGIQRIYLVSNPQKLTNLPSLAVLP